MPIVADYTPPPGSTPPAARRPCCSACASPADRARARRLVAAAARRGGALGAEEDEPLIWWPGAIQAFVDKVNTEIWTLARDMSAAIKSGKIDHASLASFKAFFNEWEGWRTGLGPLSWLTGATVATAKSYRLRNAQWRARLVSAGARPSSPEPLVEPPKPSTVPDMVKWVGIGAAAIGGAVALGHVVRGIGLFKRAPA